MKGMQARTARVPRAVPRSRGARFSLFVPHSQVSKPRLRRTNTRARGLPRYALLEPNRFAILTGKQR